jgi:DNA replication factor GINS
MKLSDLRDVQNRERSTDSLQELPDSFYADVATYVQGLKDERERAAERADDPFDDPDVNRITDEIKTAEQVAEAIYERRVGKIVRQASFAAADMSGDVSGLTAEERRLYDDITDRITENKGHVLDVLGGEDTDAGGAPSDGGAPDPDPPPDEPSPPESGVDAADLMGEDSGTDTAGSDAAEREPPNEPAADGGTAARSTVQVTREVGEIFGVDERVYTLESNDVVTLPEENADALVAKGAAEHLE